MKPYADKGKQMSGNRSNLRLVAQAVWGASLKYGLNRGEKAKALNLSKRKKVRHEVPQ